MNTLVRTIPAMLGVCLGIGSLPACWHHYSAPDGPRCADGIRMVEDGYEGARRTARVGAGETADCVEDEDIAGFVPCAAGPHPVVVYVPGTVQPHDHAFILRVLERLARRGYAAFSLEYENLWPAQDCPRYRARASCMFDTRNPDSALARICGRDDTDCSGGVAVLGHSQGGLIAILAADYTERVRWVHAMGVTANPPRSVPDLDCVLPGTRRLPEQKLLVACGDCDVFFDGTRLNSCAARSPGVTRGLEKLTGMECGSPQGCLGKDAAGARFGWIKIPGAALRDKEADHCYMFHQGCFGPPDADYLDGKGRPWDLPAIIHDIEQALPTQHRDNE